MFKKIIDYQEGKHIGEMCPAAAVFPNPLEYKVVAVKSIGYI